jgi:hypothetical protein
MRKIPLYICPAIDKKTCFSTTNCCPHRNPHQRVGSCAPKECRFNKDGGLIECVIVPDPDAPAAQPVAPAAPPEKTKDAVIKTVTSPDQAEKDDPEDAKDAD